MATITGFTSDRMLVIENETVTTGQVTNDHLILTQRGGTQIDAGNVRGPKGDTGAAGTPGAPGVIQSVNDQSIASVYSPRSFANLAAISSGWAAAPIGALAITTTEKTLWEKDEVGWFSRNDVRLFASTAERDSRWVNPPNGSICQAPAGTEFRRISGVWQPWPPIPRYAARYTVGATTSSSTASTATQVPLTTKIYDQANALSGNTYTCPVAGRYLVRASVSGGVGNGVNINCRIMRNGVIDTTEGRAQAYPTSAAMVVSCTALMMCAIGDSLELWWQTTAVSVAMRVVASEAYFAVDYLGPT